MIIVGRPKRNIRTGPGEISLSLFGPVLAEIAHRGFYKQVIGKAKYLMWGESSHVENPRWMAQRFPPFEPITYKEDVFFPNVTFVASYWDIEDWKEHQEEYKRLSGSVLDKSVDLPLLTARRDALEKQIRRNGERIKEPLNAILSILKVWAVETELGILNDRELQELDAEELKQHSDLRRDTKMLWGNIKRGMRSKYLTKSWLPKTLYRDGTLTELAEAQEAGTKVFLEQRDKLIKETIPLFRQWWAHEMVLHALLEDEDLKESKQAEKEVAARIGDVEYVKKLMDIDRRMPYIKKLREDSKTWKEIQDHLEQECKRLDIPLPYAYEESLRKAFRQYHDRRK